MFRIDRVALAAAALLLSGCAALPALTSPTAPFAPTIAVSSPRMQFTLSGRFSAKREAEQVSGQFRYAQSGAQGDLRQMSLFSPIGTPLAEITANAQSATLTLANGRVQHAASLTDLMRTVIDLPVTDQVLSAWLQGLPFDAAGRGADAAAGGAARMERDAFGAPSRFIEMGWEITISARMEGAAAAPKRMRWAPLGQPETELRWVIDEWSTP